MAEDKKKVTAKKTAPKKDVAKKKDTAVKSKTASATKKAKKTVAKPKAKVAAKTITVTQIGSPIGRKSWQRATLIGLGLNKMHKTNVLEDTAAIRGMIDRVKHLVRIEDVA